MGEQQRRMVEHGPDPDAGRSRRASGGLSDGRDAAGDRRTVEPHPSPRANLDDAEPGALGPIADERETARLAPTSSEDGASLPADSD